MTKTTVCDFTCSMKIAVLISLFLTAFLGFLSIFYRIVLFQEYAAYKTQSQKEKKGHNWLFFVLSHQLNPKFSKKYGHPTKSKMALIGILSLGSLAIFAQYVL